MSESGNWVDALQIDPDKLAGWSAQVPEGVPLLVWCLQNGHVPLEKYMAWACEQFQLPRLGAEFFQNAFDRSLIPADRPNSPWSAWCFPVGQWDGLTYLACVEPPREVPTGQFVFVLADPTAMAATWNEGLTGTGKSLTGVKVDSVAAIEMPQGMELSSVKPFRLDFGTNTGINITAPHVQENDEPVEAPAAAPAAPAAPQVAATSMDALAAELELPPTPKAKPSAFSKPAATPPPPADSGDGPDEQEIEIAFLQLKEHYLSSMILKRDGGNLSLFRWSPEQDLSALAGQSLIDLTAPSFLRIVSKTMLPYHGYVVDSELHRAFFAKLGMPALPASVTAVPLKFDGDVWGILLAIGTENAQRNKPLQAVENAVEKLKATLGAISQKAS